MHIESVNPATGQPIQSYPVTSEKEVQAALEQAQATFGQWRRTRYPERAKRMKAAAALLRQNQEDYGRLMALEMGKPLGQGLAEAEKCAWVCEYYAEKAEGFLANEQVQTESSRSFITFQPLGVILAVMPWNFPFWQVFRCAAPVLMAGNAIVLKHASNVPGCALAIERVFREAGFPEGLFRTVLIGSGQVESLIASPLIQAVTVTGSGPAGRAVAGAAGAHLKKTVLELGGSDPYLMLEDCDLDLAVEACVKARLINSGQSCIAAKRFIVAEAVREDFTERFTSKMAAASVGDPLDPTTQVGPLARRDLRDELHSQVERSVRAGARLLAGGHIPERPGWYYPPTVLADVRPGMVACQEEMFGPVAAIIGVRDEAEAVRVANDSLFGLGAAVFTRDPHRGERIAAEELEAGCCFINDFVKSDPRLPFGGVKQSGYGRELSVFGIREFVNVKTVVAGG